MAGSPALKIVRNAKPFCDPKHGPRLAVGHSTAKTPVAGDGPSLFTMTDAEIGRELRLSAKSIRRMHDAGKLPRTAMVGARSLRWVRQTIVEWLAAGWCEFRVRIEVAGKWKILRVRLVPFRHHNRKGRSRSEVSHPRNEFLRRLTTQFGQKPRAAVPEPENRFFRVQPWKAGFGDH